MSNRDKPQRRATSFDVARVAGVSRAAVSRAFTPDASVSPKTREKIYQAAKELGYRVNYVARSLTNQRSDLVGLVVAGLDNPFRSLQIEHLARALLLRNFRPILLPTSKEADTSAVIGQLLHYPVSGVIVTSDAPPTEICEQCAAEGVPIVLINKGDDIPFVDRIISDDRTAGHLAADHLIDVGCRKLAVMAASSVSYTARRRSDAFLSRSRQRGVEAQLITVRVNDYRCGFDAAPELGALSADGVFCVNDYMACGVIDRLAQNRGSPDVPPIRIVGHDDIPQAQWDAYGLTTILQPCGLQAEQTVEMLVSRMANSDMTARVEFTPVELIKRKTS
ncbi:MAG: LacI family DNA-binding transcriptional regulator [Rhizobium sp.]|uniref:LacI family DNA-binding transcriptional regulator n=1 Tax=Rhizobium sp. TaxID=391 RepID=UPI000566944E